MKKWLGAMLVVLVITAGVFAGCQKKEASSANGMKIFFSLNKMDTFRQTLVDAAEAAAKEQGAQFAVKDAQGMIETQVKDIKQAVSDGYNVIICSAVSAETAVELKASAGDLPIVFVNSRPQDIHLKAGKYVYAGSDDAAAGQFQAEYILSALASKPEINVILIKGPSGHSATTGRTKGLKQALAASGKTVRYVFEDHGDWDTAQAEKLVEIFRRTKADVDCIVCNNDAMAMGAIQACKKAGILDETLILGVDATVDGCQAIKDGEMDCTIYQSAKGQGQAAVDAAVQLVSGGSIKDIEGASEDEKYVWVPFEKVDSGNVSQYQ